MLGKKPNLFFVVFIFNIFYQNAKVSSSYYNLECVLNKSEATFECSECISLCVCVRARACVCVCVFSRLFYRK